MSMFKKNQYSWLEKKYVFLIIIVFLILNNLSFATAMVVEGSDYFTGTNYYAGADKTIYLSQIEQARQGHFLFKNLYTSEEQQGLIFSPVWLVLGIIGRLTNISNILILEFSRIILSVLFLVFIYKFICNCFSGIKPRLISLLMLCFSSGLGVFTYKAIKTDTEIFNNFGTDLWLSEGNTFLTLRHSTMFILSQILIIFIFWWIIERLKKAKWPEVLLVGLSACLLGIFHPYDIVIIGAVIVVWFLTEAIKNRNWPWQEFLKGALVGIMALLPFVYFYWLREVEPAFAGWAEQNITTSPGIYNYLVGYGLVFFLFLFGIYSCIKSENRFLRFVGVWAIVQWFLLFIPLPVQRRFANILHVSMVIIATVGLFNILKYLKLKFKHFYQSYIVRLLLVPIFFILICSTTFLNIWQETYGFTEKRPPSFISAKSYEAVKWLKNVNSRNEIILSENRMGNIIPSITGGLVYIGHGHQTVNWTDKLLETEEWFFKNNKFDVQKEEWLKSENIDYLFWSEQEKDLGDFEPEQKKYLEKVFKNSEVKIFKIK